MDRRQLLNTVSGDSGPVAWWSAQSSYVSRVGANVLTWFDRTGNGNQLSRIGGFPQYESTGGWGVGYPDVMTTGGSDELGNSTGLVSRITGAFSVLMTFQNLDVVNPTSVLAWHNAANTQWAAIRTSAATGTLNVERTDGVTLVSATGSALLGTGHRRVAVSFDGQRVTTWLDGVLDIVAVNINPGPLSLGRLSLSWPGLFAAADARFTEVRIFSSAIAPSVVAAYQTSSLADWGP
jgi:hypothetical protein